MKEAMDVTILPISVLKFKYKPAWWVLLLGFFPEPCRHKICSSEGLINLNCCGRFSFFCQENKDCISRYEISLMMAYTNKTMETFK